MMDSFPLNISSQSMISAKKRITTKTSLGYYALGLTLILALALRVWGIQFGLPYIYHVDEHFYVATALKIGQGILHNTPFAPVGFSNILFGEYAAYFLVGRVNQVFDSAQAFEAAYRTDPTAFYTIARLASAVLGTAMVFFLYILGSVVSDVAIGLFSAALLAVNFLLVRGSHHAVPDIAMASFVILTVALAALAMKRNQKGWLYLAAFVGGIAVSMKYTAFPVLLVILWASIWVCNPGKSLFSKLVNRRTVATLILFFTGFALSSPQIIINPFLYIRELYWQTVLFKDGFGPWQVDSVPGWLFIGKTMLYGVTPVVLLFSIIGLIRRLLLIMKTRDKDSVLLVLFPVSYFIYMGMTLHYFARYTYVLIPFMIFFAAEIIIVAIRYTLSIWPNKISIVTIPLVILAAIAILQPLRSSIRHNILVGRRDTRTIAKQWIETNIPAGAKIAIEIEPLGPPLRNSKKPLHPIPESPREFNVIVVGEIGLADRPPSWYVEQDFAYLVTTGFVYNMSLHDETRDENRDRFYTSLEEEFELVKTFYSRGDETVEPPFIWEEIYGPVISLWERDRPGPTIKVYKVRGGSDV